MSHPIPPIFAPGNLEDMATHVFGLAHLLGRPGADELVRQGVEALTRGPLHDGGNGGWRASTDDDTREPSNAGPQPTSRRSTSFAERQAGWSQRDGGIRRAGSRPG